jgi:hypothetical protein
MPPPRKLMMLLALTGGVPRSRFSTVTADRNAAAAFTNVAAGRAWRPDGLRISMSTLRMRVLSAAMSRCHGRGGDGLDDEAGLPGESVAEVVVERGRIDQLREPAVDRRRDPEPLALPRDGAVEPADLGRSSPVPEMEPERGHLAPTRTADDAPSVARDSSSGSRTAKASSARRCRQRHGRQAEAL